MVHSKQQTLVVRISQRTDDIYESVLKSSSSRPSSPSSSGRSRWIGGAPLEEEGVAGVTDSDWFGRRRQRKLIVRAAVTENLPTVPAVVLSSRDGELLLTKLAVTCFFVLQPNLPPLKSFVGFFDVLNLQFGFAEFGAKFLKSSFLVLTDGLQLDVFILKTMELLFQSINLQRLCAELSHRVSFSLQIIL